jgi:Putative transposase
MVRVTLKAPWHDGTTHLLFEPVEFLGKLAALVPRSRVNLVIYSGVLAPHHRWRATVVAYGMASQADVGDRIEHDRARRCGRHWRWADLMRRAFEIDVLECPRCGGRMTLIATIDDPAVIRKILAHLGLSTERPDARPARPPPGDDATFA